MSLVKRIRKPKTGRAAKAEASIAMISDGDPCDHNYVYEPDVDKHICVCELCGAEIQV